MTDNAELLNAMNALLAKTSAQTGPTANGAGWSQPQPAPSQMIQGVGVPIKIGRGRGNLKVLLWLPAECAASPQAMNAALDELERAGLPLDVWEPKESGWGSTSSSRTWRR